jgi:nicotinamidase-related amidase
VPVAARNPGCPLADPEPWETLTMATIRPGQRSVLLVVDVQVGVMDEAWDAPRVIDRVAHAVGRARAQGAPVIWVQHADEQLVHGSPAWQWVPELVPAAGDLRVHKAHNSSFEQTSLDDELARLQATHLVLAGAASNWCIRATAYGALDRGYDLTLVEDAHTTGTLVLDDGSRVEAETVVRDLNVTMRWLSYPGRRNRVAKAEALDFADAAGAPALGPAAT